MGWDLLRLAIGLVLLLVGGDLLVRGAAGIARRFGVSPTVVGLTVVAFGTSAPELVVCLVAALDGSPGIAFGNVVGSNIANAGLLLGITALVRPLAVNSTLVAREIPMMVLASAVTAVLFLDGALQGGREDALLRGDGLVLALLFGVFLYYTAADVVRSRRSDSLLREAAGHEMVGQKEGRGVPVLVGFVVAGCAGLSIGGDLMVGAASAIARSLGVGDVVIASTIVAVGTSLPELATSVLAARKNEGELALGNIVGSNIFNLLLVLGTTSLVAPVALPAGGGVDLIFMVGLAMVLLPFSLTDQRRITRTEGVVLVAIYVGFTGWQLLRPA